MKSALIGSTFFALLCVAAAPSFAESLTTSASSVASSASSAGSASLRGSSDSIKGSSDSSREDPKVAEGEYRVAAIDSIDAQPGMLRLTLEPLAANATGFQLDLPDHAFGKRALETGDVVSAHHRPYGLEFARGATAEPFFLVLADDWQRDLQTHVVVN